MRTVSDTLDVGDVLVNPAGGRFEKGREMIVVDVFRTSDGEWVDAVPVHPEDSDVFFHATYRLGRDLPHRLDPSAQPVGDLARAAWA